MLPIQIVVGVGVLLSVCEGTKRKEYIELKSIVIAYFDKILKR